jgi:hypothetical protein
MLLTSCTSAGIRPPPVRHLALVDNLWLAEEIARIQPEHE